MAEVYGLGYNGVKDGGTFLIDTTTATAIGTSYSTEEGKAYAISADGQVGYGSSGNPVFGIVEKVQKYSENATTLVASLKLTGMKEGVAITSTTASYPVVGKHVAVDGAGKLIVASTTSETNVVGKATAFSVDTTNKLAVIIL